MSGGQVMVVTGGASGIGLAVVKKLHSQGHKVISLDLPGKTDVPLFETLGIQTLSIDVTDEESVRAAHATIINEHGAVDGLVNSAGVIQKRESPDKLAMKDWDFVVDTNMRGTYLCCAVFGTHMVEKRVVRSLTSLQSRQPTVFRYMPTPQPRQVFCRSHSVWPVSGATRVFESTPSHQAIPRRPPYKPPSIEVIATARS